LISAAAPKTGATRTTGRLKAGRLKNGGGMPDIMVRCPVHSVTVSTGLSTDTVQFDSLPDCAIPLACPACGTAHRWRPRDAWVQGSLSKPVGRSEPVSS
jgi:hypothetical protein